MLNFFVLVLIFWVSLFSRDIFAQNKETIRWLVWDQVPNFILNGEYKGQGAGDTFTAMLQSHLPQYHHENVLSNTRRYHALIRQENVCVAWAWIVPGSKSFRVHSKPVSLAPRSGIHILKSKQHLFGKTGESLSLAKLLANPALKLGYLEDMSYSKKIHELIEKNRNKGNIYFSSVSKVELDLKMLDNGHVDYFFGFSAQSIFEAKEKKIVNKYQFYNIDEMDMYTSMHTHCSKTPFGYEVMTAVNKIITNDVLMAHLKIIEKWYGQNKDYRNVFIDYVINQQANELVMDPGQ